MDPVDLRPTTSALAALVRGTRDDQLAAATPCPDYTVADLLDHVGGLSFAFTAAARKDPLPPGEADASGDGSGSRRAGATGSPPSWTPSARPGSTPRRTTG